MADLVDLQKLSERVKNNFTQNFDERDCTLPAEFKRNVKNINSFSLIYDTHTVIFSGTGGNSLNSYIPNQLFYVAVFFSDYTNELFKYKKEVLSILSRAGIQGRDALSLFFSEEREHGLSNLRLGEDKFKRILEQQNIPEPTKTYLLKFVTDYNWWNGAKTIDRADFYNSSVLSTIGVTASSNATLALICGYLSEHPEHLVLLKNHDRFADVDNEPCVTEGGDTQDGVEPYQEYITLLKENYNLVLTGAPGTGKTWLANKIAEKMGAEKRFVQFHPSYDYTDFVEGLRPVKKSGDSQVGFKRMDGIFKSFCKQALQYNQVTDVLDDDSGVSSGSFEDVYNTVKNDIIRGTLKYYSNEFTVSITEDGRIQYNRKHVKTEKESNIKLLFEDFVREGIFDISSVSKKELEERITRLTNSKTRTLDFTEYKWILDKLLCRKKEIDSNRYQRRSTSVKKPFVFIIDEINRGELSKIFGELFFSIDPGYRGDSENRVVTQYQNLLEDAEDDVFKDGFYVPDNVFILATMNDIDRSVESMDFAIRRRFVWKEITADDRKGMLDEELPSSYLAKAKDTMRRLNTCISGIEQLGKAFEVGPSYFLKLKHLNGDFEKLWSLSLEPLVREYLRGFKKADVLLDAIKEAYFGTNSTPSPNNEEGRIFNED